MVGLHPGGACGDGASVWVPPPPRSPVRKGGPEPLVDFVGEDAERPLL